ncbi:MULTISPECIES: tRNA (adenosine(37)-N6)-threonylcarbamoyltransferase complex ATPase subunit type 1 TsaE [unclassified Nitratiruptor]|uniref:tRNA (adenosine(37)-N6)-threonylcarbamoyltransferase complex ATPase subunit type 1 TsaE n=1 Tax=unclassified Nitratiruptor TaxID=2624044 RepID=UPI0019151ACA|nr:MULTISPECIES: tRNA (adenosine(37)-N6)-threonylcarbamoyltransferase complex ATPase subunit type 1 TsaE [unclassified Nitratiruptor]BCD60430.1 tRNA threonylcarbamoyladenosine biosynthesis protein TsaE [Nitratiruptor sp. YY08-10]BCD64081.1 tRNA threonylcarbamoyladenosine biosynthesis protein TsaE [Nitratiruptor sp. YY08-14]
MKFELDQHHLEPVVSCIQNSKKNIILLEGDLGAGKTTLVKAFAKSLGQEGVTSPTFSIQQVYGDKIYHYDLYNAGFAKFMELGLFEELEKPGYHFIEWPDENLKNFLKELGYEYLEIEIVPKNEKREYRCID